MAVTKHGLSGSPLYKAWENMRSRAAGGTGCEDVWVTFEGFLMNPPSAGPSPLDGVERDFAPGLCVARTTLGRTVPPTVGGTRAATTRLSSDGASS